MDFLEPIYLNEQMLLNAAAYLFDGYSLISDLEKGNDFSGSGSAKVKFSLANILQLGPELSAEAKAQKTTKTRETRQFTLGGIHMNVLDELKNKSLITDMNSDIRSGTEKVNGYVAVDVILHPTDFFEILQLLRLSQPVIIQLLDTFMPTVFEGSQLSETNRAQQISNTLTSLLDTVHNDYLSSKNLEMIMTDANNGDFIGIADIDLSYQSASELKAKLTDGRFRVVGKVTRAIGKKHTLSTVQRTSLSQIISVVTEAMELFEEHQSSSKKLSLQNNISDKPHELSFAENLKLWKPKLERFIKLELPGPAVRLLTMSVSV